MSALSPLIRNSAWLAVLPVCIVLAYWPGLGGGFAFDDYPNIVFNKALHVTTLAWQDLVSAAFSSNSSDLQRPLAMFTFALQHYFTGLDPRALKAGNIAIHGVNVLLAFALARALLRAGAPIVDTRLRDRAAFLCAALWALMPINLMPVLLVVQRMESLSHTFVFAGLLLYLAGRERQLRAQGGGGLILAGLLACTALGTLSKESAVLLPLYAACAEAFLFRFRDAQGRRDRRLCILFVVVLVVPALLGGTWMVMRALKPWAYASRDFTLVERLLTEPRVVADYLQWILLPRLDQLSLYHDDYVVSRGLLSPVSTVPAMLLLAALAVVAAWLRTRRPLMGLGIAWFLAAQLLTATFLPLELVYEHRNYFASFGIALALVDACLLLPHTRSAQRTGAVVLTCLLALDGATTWLRAREWSDPVRFAITTAAKHPGSPRATYQLAQTYVIQVGADVHSPLVPKAFDALERARRVPRAGILPAQGLLILASRTGRPMQDAWWQEMHDRLQQGPISAQDLGALNAMTSCEISGHCHFPPRRMLALFMAALSHGDRAELLNIYGNYALNVLQDWPLAEQLWTRAREVSPGIAQYRINLIKLLIAKGDWAKAEREIAELRTLGRLGETQAAADAMERRLRDRYAGAALAP